LKGTQAINFFAHVKSATISLMITNDQELSLILHPKDSTPRKHTSYFKKRTDLLILQNV